MVIRKPIPGTDDNTWGTVLNNYLDASHNADGTLKDAAINAAATTINAKLARTDPGIFDVRVYGPVSSSTSDATVNTSAINAAASAAAAVGGIVRLAPFAMPINGVVTIPAGASTLGAGSNISRLVGTHVNAFINFPDPTYTSHEGWDFDGNNISTFGVRIETSNASFWRGVKVTRVAGESFSLYNVQNSTFIDITVRDSRDGLRLDAGTGSCVFEALKCSSNEYWQLKIGNSYAMPAGSYTEPTANVFIAPMLEWITSTGTVNSEAVVRIDGSSRTRFINGNFASGTLTTAITLYKSATVGTNAESHSAFESCFFGGKGSDIGIQLGATSSVEFDGITNIINGTSVGVDFVHAQARMAGELPVMRAVATPYQASNGAYVDGAIERVYTGRQNLVTSMGAWQTLLRLQRAGEAGVRFALLDNGRLSWGDGTGFTYDVELERSGPETLGVSGGFRSGLRTTTGRPLASTVGSGVMIYDTTLGKPIWSNGTVWKDAAGTTV